MMNTMGRSKPKGKRYIYSSKGESITSKQNITSECTHTLLKLKDITDDENGSGLTAQLAKTFDTHGNVF